MLYIGLEPADAFLDIGLEPADAFLDIAICIISRDTGNPDPYRILPIGSMLYKIHQIVPHKVHLPMSIPVINIRIQIFDVDDPQ